MNLREKIFRLRDRILELLRRRTRTRNSEKHCKREENNSPLHAGIMKHTPPVHQLGVLPPGLPKDHQP